MNETSLSKGEIEKLQGYLKKYRIDHQYDPEVEYFDCKVPPGQIAVRMAFELLKKYDKLPQGIAWIEEELKRNS